MIQTIYAITTQLYVRLYYRRVSIAGVWSQHFDITQNSKECTTTPGFLTSRFVVVNLYFARVDALTRIYNLPFDCMLFWLLLHDGLVFCCSCE